MTNGNGKITPPISIDDVRAVLGAGSYDVATLCVHTSINRWAKYKPVVLASIEPSRTGDWWKSTANNCGLSYRSYTTINNLISAIDGGTSDWVYTRPSGGYAAPYRLADFYGYNHYAVCPIGAMEVPAVAQVGNGKTLEVYVPYRTGNADSVQFTDINGAAGLSAKYFGAVLKNKSTGAYQWMTTANTLGSGAVCTINFDISGILTGGYKVYPFLTDIKKTNPTDPDVSGDFIPLPAEVGTYREVTLQSASPDYTCVVYVAKNGNGDFSYSVKFTNSTSSSMTFKNIYLNFYQRADGVSATGDKIPINNKTITVAANDSYTFSGVALVTDNPFKLWRLNFTDNTNALVTKSGNL